MGIAVGSVASPSRCSYFAFCGAEECGGRGREYHCRREEVAVSGGGYASVGGPLPPTKPPGGHPGNYCVWGEGGGQFCLCSK